MFLATLFVLRHLVAFAVYMPNVENVNQRLALSSATSNLFITFWEEKKKIVGILFENVLRYRRLS